MHTIHKNYFFRVIFSSLFLLFVLFLYYVSVNSSFEKFMISVFEERLSDNTLSLHYTLKDASGYDIPAEESSLGHLNYTSFHKSISETREQLKKLNLYFPSHLSLQNRLNYDLLKDDLQNKLSLSHFYYYQEYLGPISGYHNQLPILFDEFRMKNEQDITLYLSLLSQTDTLFDELIVFENQKAKYGLFMNDTLARDVISACDSFVENPKTHHLIVSFDKKIDQLSHLSSEKKQWYKEKNKIILTSQVLPAYQKLSSSMKSLIGSGKNNGGLCHFSHGRHFYLLSLKQSVGSSESPEKLLSKIEKHRNALSIDIQNLLKEHPSLLLEKPRFSSNSSKDMILELKEKISADFPCAPSCHLTLKTVDTSLQDTASPAFYMVPPIDESSQNTIYINPSKTSQSTNVFTTLAHEGYPGHLYQTTRSAEFYTTPLRSLLNYPGFSEGWATYAEYYSYRYLPMSSSASALLQKNNDIILSLYASLDLLIHYEGYTLNDTALFLKKYGISDESVISSIYQSVIAEPANYLKYYLGYLNILELRQYAYRLSKEQNRNFSIRNFHDVIIQIGEAPFYIIKKYLPEFLNNGSHESESSL